MIIPISTGQWFGPDKDGHYSRRFVPYAVQAAEARELAIVDAAIAAIDEALAMLPEDE